MTKNYMQNGKWIDKPTITVISVCKCGNKYIKTREGQTGCLRCLAEAKVDA